MIQHIVTKGRHYVRQIAGGSLYVYANAGTYTGKAYTRHGETCDLKFADHVTIPLDAKIVGVASFASEDDLERMQNMIGTEITHEVTLEAWLIRMAIDNDSPIWKEI